MKTVAIIQARMGSSRLPGKVMKVLADKTVLGHVMTRVQTISSIDEIVIATTDHPQDDILVQEARNYGVRHFRGDEQHVLSRYYAAAIESKADAIVRVTSDCPMIDPDVSSMVIDMFHSSGADYASNSLERTFPRGLDTEVFSFEALEKAYRLASLPEEKEHVTPYIYRHPDQFHLISCRHEQDLSHYRWTLDTAEDFELIQKLYDNLYTPDRLFTWKDVLEYLAKHPEITRINGHVKQKSI